jgi:hypothetical protein
MSSWLTLVSLPYRTRRRVTIRRCSPRGRAPLWSRRLRRCEGMPEGGDDRDDHEPAKRAVSVHTTLRRADCTRSGLHAALLHSRASRSPARLTLDRGFQLQQVLAGDNADSGNVITQSARRLMNVCSPNGSVWSRTAEPFASRICTRIATGAITQRAPADTHDHSLTWEPARCSAASLDRLAGAASVIEFGSERCGGTLVSTDATNRRNYAKRLTRAGRLN